MDVGKKVTEVAEILSITSALYDKETKQNITQDNQMKIAAAIIDSESRIKAARILACAIKEASQDLVEAIQYHKV